MMPSSDHRAQEGRISGAAPADPRFMAFVDDEASRDALRRLAAEEGWLPEAVAPGGIEGAIAAMAGMDSPALLVVDLSSSGAAMADIDRLAEVCRPGTAVIAIGTVNDVGFYRELTAAGIGDYLVKPVSVPMLQRSLQRLRETRPSPARPAETAAGAVQAKGRVTVVLGARGGVGTSTVAVNLAWLLGHERSRKVVLADLDVQFGTDALALDLEPGRGLREVLQNPDRLDGLFMQRAMVRESDRLFILGSEENLDEPLSFDPAAADRLAGELRQGFDQVVVDLPRGLGAMERRFLAGADRIVLVTELSVTALRDTIRLTALCRRRAPEARLVLVANKVGIAGKGELSRADFERGLERKLDFLIPFDAAAAAECANTGKPLAAAGANRKLADALRSLAAALDDGPSAQASAGSGGFWRRWRR